MARVRSRGHSQILRAAPARSRHGQGEPAEDHRRRCRLAVLERPQTRAEGVSANRLRRLPMPMMQTRRRFLTTSALASAAGLAPIQRVLAAEGALEKTTIRLPKSAAICSAPGYVADELLRAEGFTDIRYVELLTPTAPVEAVARGRIDFGLNYASNYVAAIDAGEPIMLLAGVMVGCYELFGSEGIRNVADLKGKSVGVQGLGSTGNVLVTMMAAHVGLDPAKDIHWVTDPALKPIELFVQGKIDAFLAFPPAAQDLRARHIGK